MLWYCHYRWRPHARAEAVKRRLLRQHDAGTNHPDKMRGWYAVAGGAEGFMFVETDDPQVLTEILEPYRDLVEWETHAVNEVVYEPLVEAYRTQVQRDAQARAG